MNRRNFIGASALAGLGLTLKASASNDPQNELKNIRGTFSTNDNQAAIYTRAQITPTKLFHITDTHLSMDDERGEPYREYSARMAAAYNSNAHFQSGETYSAEKSFELTLETAKKEKVDFIALTGDIFSFPSEAAVKWAWQQLEETKIPYAYVAGNHDWHYEGMTGSAVELRNTWTEKRLTPMYQGNHPLYAAYDLNGIRVVCIDNSTYEILPEQWAFFKAQMETELPLLLLMHIPLYMPGRSMGFGCGHPQWGEKSDRNYKTERREKWRKEGHTNITMDFCRDVFTAPNLLAVLAGHTHRQSLDIKNGIPQVVSRDNACGYYASLNFKTLNE
jgi:predicted phosphodiesterase